MVIVSYFWIYIDDGAAACRYNVLACICCVKVQFLYIGGWLGWERDCMHVTGRHTAGIDGLKFVGNLYLYWRQNPLHIVLSASYSSYVMCIHYAWKRHLRILCTFNACMYSLSLSLSLSLFLPPPSLSVCVKIHWERERENTYVIQSCRDKVYI